MNILKSLLIPSALLMVTLSACSNDDDPPPVKEPETIDFTAVKAEVDLNEDAGRLIFYNSSEDQIVFNIIPASQPTGNYSVSTTKNAGTIIGAGDNSTTDASYYKKGSTTGYIVAGSVNFTFDVGEEIWKVSGNGEVKLGNDDKIVFKAVDLIYHTEEPDGPDDPEELEFTATDGYYNAGSNYFDIYLTDEDDQEVFMRLYYTSGMNGTYEISTETKAGVVKGADGESPVAEDAGYIIYADGTKDYFAEGEIDFTFADSDALIMTIDGEIITVGETIVYLEAAELRIPEYRIFENMEFCEFMLYGPSTTGETAEYYIYLKDLGDIPTVFNVSINFYAYSVPVEDSSTLSFGPGTYTPAPYTQALYTFNANGSNYHSNIYEILGGGQTDNNYITDGYFNVTRTASVYTIEGIVYIDENTAFKFSYTGTPKYSDYS